MKRPNTARNNMNSVAPSRPPFPAQVCVLDIETEDTDFADKANCKVAVVGVKIYALADKENEYVPVKYVHFLADQMGDLGAFLSAFPGVFIGHNILEFDYAVLRQHVALEGVIERTVDTLFFLYKKNGQRLNGLKLDGLCKENFGIGKTNNGAAVPQMWKEGKREEVIRYNETDCDLTLRLWQHLATATSVRLPPQKNGRQKTLNIEARDINALLGTKPALKYPEWLRRQVKNERLITFPMKAIALSGFDDDGFDDDGFDEFGDDGLISPREYGHATFYCDQCDTTSLFEGTIIGGCAAHETAPCPTCGKGLGTMREDEAEKPTCLGSLPGNLGNGISQGMIATGFEEILAKHIQATRGSWLQDDEPIGDQCHICGKTPHAGYASYEEFYENPMDGTPICLTCMTACRWILSVR